MSGRATSGRSVAPARGDSLIAALGCARCHGGLAVPAAPMPAPPLGDVGLRYSTAWLVDYLRSPTPLRRATGAARMPDFAFDEGEALAVALYLATLTSRGSQPSEAGGPSAAAVETRTGGARRDSLERALSKVRARNPRATPSLGRRIVESQGCAACHDLPGLPGWVTGPDLRGEGSRVREEWLRAWLRRPTAVRPFGTIPGSGSRMPDFRLTSAEADAIAAHLMRGRDPLVAAARFEPATVSAFRMRQTATWVERRLSCLGCHAVGGRGGRIGPALDGAAVRLQPAFVFRMIVDPQHTVPGTVMPRAPLPLDDAARVANWVLSLSPPDSAFPWLSLAEMPPSASAPAAGGARSYARLCASCHGATGGGDGYNARFLPVAPARHADAAAMSRRADDVLYDGIAAGGLVLGRSPRMPAFGQALAPAEIQALVRHIRAICRCEGPAWSRDGARP